MISHILSEWEGENRYFKRKDHNNSLKNYRLSMSIKIQYSQRNRKFMVSKKTHSPYNKCKYKMRNLKLEFRT